MHACTFASKVPQRFGCGDRAVLRTAGLARVMAASLIHAPVVEERQQRKALDRLSWHHVEKESCLTTTCGGSSEVAQNECRAYVVVSGCGLARLHSLQLRSRLCKFLPEHTIFRSTLGQIQSMSCLEELRSFKLKQLEMRGFRRFTSTDNSSR